MTTVQGDGNILSSVLYDGEGRVCATRQPLLAGLYKQTQYVYDAEGNRVAEGMITDWSKGCDLTQNGFQQTKTYIVGPGGEQMTELSVDATQTSSWVHTNVQANGRLIATYANDSSNCTSSQSVPCQPSTGALHFILTDWLGTKRVQTTYDGTTESAWANLPFGDGQQVNCTSCSGADASEQHFTGKERDAESGLDNFGARYMASTMGRFMSPDYSEDPVPVPYASLSNPQSLNLYAYAGNNPLSFVDEDGHDGAAPTATCSGIIGCAVGFLKNLFSGGGNGGNGGSNGNGNGGGNGNGNGGGGGNNGDGFGGISPTQGRQIINNAKTYLNVPYSQNVAASSPDNKRGTQTGIDCSHLVCFASSLIYSTAENVANNPNLRKLNQGEAPQDGDIVVFVGGGHVVLWDASPPKVGYNLLGATTHHGVTWLPMSNKQGTQTFRGKPVFYRVKKN